MAGPDNVSGSSDFFGITPGLDSTGAPGTSNGNASPNALNPSGAATTDFASGISDSASVGSVGYFPGVGAREDAADLYRPSSFGADSPATTGAGEGSVGHNATGVN